MNALAVALFVCLVVITSAKPSGIWGYAHGHGHLPVVGASGIVSSHGAAGPSGVVNGHGAVGPAGITSAHGGWAGAWGGHDDGQWHGEGLLESQDLAGHGAHGVAIAAHGIGLLGHHGHW